MEYDPAEPSKDDVGYFGHGERHVRGVVRGVITKIYYTDVLESTIRGLQRDYMDWEH